MKKVLCNYKYDLGVDFDLYLYKGHYASNNRLYLGLEYYNKEYNEDPLLFDDLTINLNNINIENDNIVFINGDIPEELLKKLEKIGLLAYLNKVEYNYGTYLKYVVNEDVMNKYLKEITA